MTHDDLLQLSALEQWSLRGDRVEFRKQWSSCFEEGLYYQTQEYEYMKRKLTGDQFGTRYPMIEPPRLAYALQEYAHDLAHGLNRSRILLTEIPLKHELVRRPDLPPGKNEDIILTLLRGYRIYRIKRSAPDDNTLLAIFSRMTKCWHRVGYADLGPAAVVWDARERYTDAGCSSLADEMLGRGPESVPDDAMLRCLVLDPLPAPYRYYVALIARKQWDNSSWLLGEALKQCGLALDKDTPSPVSLARVLNSDRPSLARIWETVDRYGFPDGPLGEALRHMDKFRTF